MKIALVALPQPDDSPAIPPLPLAYAAALLEQQRHIVRIYDLSVRGSSPHGDPLASLRTFRPHLTVIAAADSEQAADLGQRLTDLSATVLHLGLAMRSWADVARIAGELRSQHAAPVSGEDDQNVIAEVLLALEGDLDSLPAPARHLLPLEQYPAYTPTGDLQTPVLIGRPVAGGHELRSPAPLISELRSVTTEHGMLHFLLEGAPLTHDLAWLHELLRRLAAADLGIGWEGSAAYSRLSPALLRQMREAGCEALDLAFDAMSVIDAQQERVSLTAVVELAHELGIKVHATITLESRFSSVPALVDMSATFGLDDVRFTVEPQPAPGPAEEQPPIEEIAQLVRSRYQSSRSRQYFVERYGARLGPVLWHVGRTGLLGQGLRQRAVGGEGASEVVAKG